MPGRGNLRGMSLLRSTLQNHWVQRALMVVWLTSFGTFIIHPYFEKSTSFAMLWHRLVVVALVMLGTFYVTTWMWRRATQPRLSLLQAQLATLPVAAFVGTVVSGLLLGRSLTQMFSNEAMVMGIIVFVTLSISLGALVTTLLVYRERTARAEVSVAVASARENGLQRQVVEARLKLLQAQIEPHFLFNTLATVQHLVGRDPILANQVLTSLIRYLRAALPQMREDASTLGRELELARAYLDIQRVRMGQRLVVQIDVDPAHHDLSFPPMMLMTLVENAIKHGIDPLQVGGTIWIEARVDEGVLRVAVSDNGAGVNPTSGGGVGLQNVRDRLVALYGARASMELNERDGGGVKAILTVPTQGTV
jgi:sensor histidine kinase YesM